MSSSDTYQDFLSSVHSSLVTPDEVIVGVVQDTLGKEITAKDKIIAGEANEVYDLTLSDNSHRILRISRNGPPDFQQEKWAIEKAERVGVPTPEILAITYRKIGEQELAFCLMNKVDGAPLERGSIDFPSLPVETQKTYIHQAGEILAKIHSIKTEGFGSIIGEGDTEYNTADELLNNYEERRDQLYTIEPNDTNLRSLIDTSFTLIEKFRPLYKVLPTFLNHGDYGHKHMMVKDEKIIAILDWGGVRSETPIYDFMCWDYWFGDGIPTEWLKEGYTDKSLFDTSFDEVLHYLRVMKGLEIIGWYGQLGFQHAVDLAIKKLHKDVAFFT